MADDGECFWTPQAGDIVWPGCDDNCECDVTYCRKDNPLLTLNDPFPVGCTKINWIAVDDENVTTCTTLVCVDDTQAPVIDNCAQSIEMGPPERGTVMPT